MRPQAPQRGRPGSLGGTGENALGSLRSGVYLLLLWLPRRRRVRVGGLGPVSFSSGLYVYAGSARRALGARIARHWRRIKAPRWHIDYLRRHARLVGAAVAPWAPGRECRLARAALRFPAARAMARGFGSSDCGCLAHLAHLGEAPGLGVDGRGGDAMRATGRKRADADLKTLAAVARELGASSGALRRAVQDAAIQSDVVRCGCAYYGPRARATMRKLVKA